MGDRCRDCHAAVRRAGLAMSAFAGAGPRGDTGRRSSSILAAGDRSNCCLRDASAEDWTALKASTGPGSIRIPGVAQRTISGAVGARSQYSGERAKSSRNQRRLTSTTSSA
jgi:hypothetical protein